MVKSSLLHLVEEMKMKKTREMVRSWWHFRNEKEVKKNARTLSFCTCSLSARICKVKEWVAHCEVKLSKWRMTWDNNEKNLAEFKVPTSGSSMLKLIARYQQFMNHFPCISSIMDS